ncbi:MAG TPA: hypothetical protein VFC25_18215 [Verrucomicrobiae bacterium]|nr:hypothetical protein [Verrucomicrobiae bacterium]
MSAARAGGPRAPAAGAPGAKVVLGLKAHSGWAALVALGFRRPGARELDGAGAQVVERRRLDLFEKGSEWVKAPYHAAESLKPEEARRMVDRGVAAAHRNAARALRETVSRLRAAGHDPVACAILVGTSMPSWTTDEILAVHFRMHKAEGVLWRDALASGAKDAGLAVVPVPEKELQEIAPDVLHESWSAVTARVDAFRKAVGAPWGKDQKDAAIAALVGRRRAGRASR